MSDGIAVTKYLLSRRDLDPEKIVLFGRSIGGAVAIHLAALDVFRSTFLAVIVENTFTSIGEMIDKVIPFLRFAKPLVSNPWNSSSAIQKVTVPILFIVGMKDNLVPPSMSDTLHDLATASRYRKMIKFTNGSHMDTYLLDSYYPRLASFLASISSRFQELPS